MEEEGRAAAQGRRSVNSGRAREKETREKRKNRKEKEIKKIEKKKKGKYPKIPENCGIILRIILGLDELAKSSKFGFF